MRHSTKEREIPDYRSADGRVVLQPSLWTKQKSKKQTRMNEYIPESSGAEGNNKEGAANGPSRDNKGKKTRATL